MGNQEMVEDGNGTLVRTPGNTFFAKPGAVLQGEVVATRGVLSLDHKAFWWERPIADDRRRPQP
jgi:hypothetical protein